MSKSKLEKRRKAAIEEWQKLDKNKKPVIIFGTGTCGTAAGALHTMKKVKCILADLKVDADIIEVGCIGPCYLEPLMDVKLPGKPRISFSNVNESKAEKILKKFFVDDEIPKLGLVGHFGENSAFNGEVPRFFDHPMLKPQVRLVLRNCGIIDPAKIDHYLARDGYLALEQVLSMRWEDV
ncbi:hypothetical protein KKB99_06405, partial [bacterium]|nr:hypothetical protein [bacterium]MBU1025620.1 hypothetical protein [bacterium]